MNAPPLRWDWAPDGTARLRRELERDGIAWVRIGPHADEARLAPWNFAERILGERPLLVERQPIRPIPGGRSYASGTMVAPFHTDSQCLLGVPAAVQVMVCVRPAARGGECLFLDTWALVERLERDDPRLLGRLFSETRRQPFVFGAVDGPTLARRGGHLVFTHSAVAEDDCARLLRPHLERAPVIELRPEVGDMVVASNHRLLHGRRSFDDGSREFTRLLIWRVEPFPPPAALRQRASEHASAPWSDPETRRRLETVLALLRATPAGILSAREGVSEQRLYRWRDAAVEAMLAALGTCPGNDGGHAPR